MSITIEQYKIMRAEKEATSKDTPEMALQKKAVKYLRLSGFTVMRVNSSSKRTGHGGILRSYFVYGKEDAATGFPDLQAFKGDRFLVLELKAKKGKQRPSQIEFQKFWEDRGHNYYIADTLEKVVEIVREFER